MFKINTYNYLSKNKLIHAKIPKSFRDKIKEKIIKKYSSLRRYCEIEKHCAYPTLQHEFAYNYYFKLTRLLKMTRDVGIDQNEVYTNIEAFFARGSNTGKITKIPKIAQIDEFFVEGFALYFAEGDNGANGTRIPKKVRFTNNKLDVIYRFKQWLLTYFPNNSFYVKIYASEKEPPLREEEIQEVADGLRIKRELVKVKYEHFKKKTKTFYRICCDSSILAFLIIILESTVKALALHDEKLARAYIRGMMIGEGTAYAKRMRYVRVEMRNENEIKYLNLLFEKLNFKVTCYERNTRKGMWVIYVGASQLARFNELIGFGIHKERQIEKAVAMHS